MQACENIDLRRLRSFSVVAKAGGFGKASISLGVTQPALTRSIQSLEKELGNSLFRRHSKGISLTEEGRRLLAVYETIEKSLGRLNAIGSGAAARRSVTIGLPPSLGPLLLPALYRRTRQLWPGDDFKFIEAQSDALEAQMGNGELDAAFIYDGATIDDAVSAPLVQETLMLVFPQTWPFKPPPRPLRLREVAALPAILPSAGCSERRAIARAERRNGIQISPVLEVDVPSTIRSLVSEGVGYTIATEQAVSGELQAGRVRTHPLETPSLKTTLSLSINHNARMTRRMSEVVSMARAIASGLIESGKWPGATMLEWSRAALPDESKAA